MLEVVSALTHPRLKVQSDMWTVWISQAAAPVGRKQPEDKGIVRNVEEKLFMFG